MRRLAMCLIFVSQAVLASVGQQPASDSMTSASCTFDDGQQLTVRYNNPSANGKQDFRDGKVWEVNGSPMLLFTQTAITVGNSDVPAGAFSLYIIPEKHKWTLVVSKNVSAGAKYDETQNLAKAPMEIGETESPYKQPEIAFGLLGPKQCNMRVYFGQTGAWAEFKEK